MGGFSRWHAHTSQKKLNRISVACSRYFLKKQKQMSEAVFVRFTAHSNMEGPHESFRVCHFFKLWTEIAFLPLISLSYSFSLTASEKGKKKKKQAGAAQTSTEAVLHLIQNNSFCLLIFPREAGLFPPVADTHNK